MRHVYMLALAVAGVAFLPLAASAEGPIKIGTPIPLSGPTAVYGVPVLKGAEMAVAEMPTARSLAASSRSCRGTARPMPTRRCGSRAN
jgi:hypothetical protein